MLFVVQTFTSATTTTYLNQVKRTERIALSVRRSQRISEQLVLVMFPLVTKHIAGKALWEPREKEKGTR